MVLNLVFLSNAHALAQEDKEKQTFSRQQGGSILGRAKLLLRSCLDIVAGAFEATPFRTLRVS